MRTTILGLGGSLRPDSSTLWGLNVALKGVRDSGLKTQLVDLATLHLPMFSGTSSWDSYSRREQAAISTLLSAVARSQGMILASPTYHNTLSGAVKNALDFLELLTDGLNGKAVGLMTIQGGTSGTGVNTLTTMLLATRAIGAWVVPTMVSVPGGRSAFDKEKKPHSRDIHERLLSLGTEVAKASEILSTHWH